MPNKLSLEICQRLKPWVNQSVYCGDWYYPNKGDDKPIIYPFEDSLFKVTGIDTIHIRIPTEQDLRDVLTPEEYRRFICKTYQSFLMPTIKSETTDKEIKDNYLQLLADFVLSLKEKK